MHSGISWVLPVPVAAVVRSMVLNSVLSGILDDFSEHEVARLTVGLIQMVLPLASIEEGTCF